VTYVFRLLYSFLWVGCGAVVAKEADAKGVEYCYVEVKDAGKSAVEVSCWQK
jgi:hypothetical protein